MKPQYFQAVKLNGKPVKEITLADADSKEGLENLFKMLKELNIEMVEITEKEHSVLQTTMREKSPTVIIE